MEGAGQENAVPTCPPAHQMNGASVVEGVDGGRAVRSQFRFRNMEYGKGSFSALTFALWQADRSPWTQDQLQDQSGCQKPRVFSLSYCIE